MYVVNGIEFYDCEGAKEYASSIGEGADMVGVWNRAGRLVAVWDAWKRRWI